MPDGVRKKTISYETYIFANELDKTVYMYEKTTEVGGGLSFGGGVRNIFPERQDAFPQG